MKRIDAFIKPEVAEAVRHAMLSAGVDVVFVNTIHQFANPGRSQAEPEERGKALSGSERVWLMAFVESQQTVRITGVIRNHARTETPFDGRIVISHVENVYSLNQGS
ncbi:MAG: hypothetical protein O3C45_08220 [Bacteroidetes bacterium]|nr:hypothetical protein [Bacteroidota bacterium]